MPTTSGDPRVDAVLALLDDLDDLPLAEHPERYERIGAELSAILTAPVPESLGAEQIPAQPTAPPAVHPAAEVTTQPAAQPTAQATAQPIDVTEPALELVNVPEPEPTPSTQVEQLQPDATVPAEFAPAQGPAPELAQAEHDAHDSDAQEDRYVDPYADDDSDDWAGPARSGPLTDAQLAAIRRGAERP